MSKIYRYEVPVDDQWHEYPELNGDVIHVAARKPTVVEFWAEHYDPDEFGAAVARLADEPRRLRVYGTGQPLPPQPYIIHGTALVNHLVWHLIEDGVHLLGEPGE